MSTSTKSLRLTDRFADVSEFGRAIGFDVAFRQLGNGAPSIPATAVLGEHVTLSHMRFACSYHQMGLPTAGQLTFGIPITGLRNWFGNRYRDSSILPFNQAGGIDGVSEEDFEAMTVSLPEDYLVDISQSFGIPAPDWLFCPAPESVIDRGEMTERLRNMLGRVFADPDTVMSQELEDELIITLLGAAQNLSSAIDRSSPALRNRALRKALSFIADHQEEPVSVREICLRNGIALRTLNRAFNERFGIGTKMYLKRHRLSAVRTELLRRPPNVRIADIANRWGFWHLGQFACDYRKLFRELPSQTVRR